MTPPSLLTSTEGWLILACYAVIMTWLVYKGTKPDRSKDEHLVANRSVGVWAGAFSIAVTWIWAPAVFICAQKSYQQGLAGIFWFTVPNILCFFTFAPLAVRIRRQMPDGYSLPDYMWQRFGGSKRVHLSFLLVTLGYDISAIVSNSLAGGLLVSAISGIPLSQAVCVIAAIALFYSIWRGFPASIITDVIQMILILFVAFILVPWTVIEVGGIGVVVSGLSGVDGSINVFDPWIAYSFGIPATLGLIAGPVGDQMFYQRVMSSRFKQVAATFMLGGLVFGVVPLTLSLFGFIAAAPEVASQLTVSDPQMVNVQVVQTFLPRWTLFGFGIMVLCALSSTLDSAYCAIGSLFSVDIYKRYINPAADDRQMVRASQIGMFALALAGTAIALIPGIKILWVFLIGGALASAALVPVFLSVYLRRIQERAVFWGVFIPFLIGLPLSIYANASENAHLVVFSAVTIVLLSAVLSLGLSIRSSRPL